MNIPVEEVVSRLNENTWRILEFIKDNPNCYVKAINETLGFKRDKASKEISRLEGGVLIESNRNDTDNRIISYTITEYGKKALDLRSNM